ncbi:hypothetical protein [Anaerococcus nagyae]|jgi:hypothetical protein|uniref:Uncharacterized protein n=1 Tax=Anaerococcus nagyae TaxID=1755241 RepID=A0A3E2TF97_9FIRM|nr:hypothetical protein [Anaerococcus nagyae]RGB74296.1 hypothetical protein DXA39_08695 [Anaerococcus nagyae]
MYKDNKLTSVRLIKSEKKFIGLPEINVYADFPIIVLDDTKYFYEIEEEFVFYLEHPPLDDVIVADLEIILEEEVKIEKVLIEKQYYYFTQENNVIRISLTFDNLPLKTSTLSVHSIIRREGQTMRIEHNQETRFVGLYEDYPELQIKAVLHYMFACWEILNISEIASSVSEDKIGHFAILGFETNNALHPDFPPHWHLILRWPYRVGSQAPHIYVDADGKNIKNISSIDGIPGFKAEFKPEEWMNLVDMYGESRLAIKVDDDGGYSLKSNDIIYKVSPFKNDKDEVYINNNPLFKLKLTDDSEKGVLIARYEYISKTNHLEIQYDKYTGKIKNVKEWVD